MMSKRAIKYFYCLPIIFSLGLVGCNDAKKKQLEETYQKVFEARLDYEKLHPYLDENAIKYIESITDTANHSFEKMMRIGETYGLEISTPLYLQEFAKENKNAADKNQFLFYCALKSIPLFELRAFQKVKLRPKKTRVGRESFVVIAGYPRKVGQV